MLIILPQLLNYDTFLLGIITLLLNYLTITKNKYIIFMFIYLIQEGEFHEEATN